MSFAQPTDMLARYDYRVIAQLVTDTGIPATVDELLTDPNLLASLADASGEILMSAQIGNRYTEADLNNLTEISQAYLIRLTCDLSLYFLIIRRGTDVEDYPQAANAQKILALIAGRETNI